MFKFWLFHSVKKLLGYTMWKLKNRPLHFIDDIRHVPMLFLIPIFSIQMQLLSYSFKIQPVVLSYHPVEICFLIKIATLAVYKTYEKTIYSLNMLDFRRFLSNVKLFCFSLPQTTVLFQVWYLWYIYIMIFLFYQQK